MNGGVELGRHGLAQGAQMPTDYADRIGKAYDFQKDQIQGDINRERADQKEREGEAKGLLKSLQDIKALPTASRELHAKGMDVRAKAMELMPRIKQGDPEAMAELQGMMGEWKAEADNATAVKGAYDQIWKQASKNGANTTQATWDKLDALYNGNLDAMSDPNFINFGAETVPDINTTLAKYKEIFDRNTKANATAVDKDGKVITTETLKTSEEARQEVEQMARDQFKVWQSQGILEDMKRVHNLVDEQDWVDRALMQTLDKEKTKVADAKPSAIEMEQLRQKNRLELIRQRESEKKKEEDLYKDLDINTFGTGEGTEYTTSYQGAYNPNWFEADYPFETIKASVQEIAQPSDVVVFKPNLDSSRLLGTEGRELEGSEEGLGWTSNDAKVDKVMVAYVKDGKIVPKGEGEPTFMMEYRADVFKGERGKDGERITEEESYLAPVTEDVYKALIAQDSKSARFYDAAWNKFGGGSEAAYAKKYGGTVQQPSGGAQPTPQEDTQPSGGLMAGFNTKKKNNEQAVESTPVTQNTIPTQQDSNVMAQQTPDTSRYGHLIAMEEGFGGAVDPTTGKATKLVGVYNEDQAREYENSTEPLKNYATGGMAYYGAEGNKNRNPKRGLRTDVTPAVYDDLSDPAKLILQTEHFNMGWDPRVLLLKVAGMMGNNTRGELHNDGGKLLKQWNSVINDPKKLAKFKKAISGKEEEMLNNLEEIMQGTTGNQDQYAKRIAYLRNQL